MWSIVVQSLGLSYYFKTKTSCYELDPQSDGIVDELRRAKIGILW